MSLPVFASGLPTYKTASGPIVSLLKAATRAPAAYALVQVPTVINPATNSQDYNKLGSQIILDKLTSVRRQSILEPGSDSCDVTFSDQTGSTSAINPSSPLGRYFFPGAIDNKVQVYMGLQKSGATVLVPKGTYIMESYNIDEQPGTNSVTLNLLDQASIFTGQVYTQFPPRLYGNQGSSYFNPNYALSNPSGDNKTFCCDAVNWMQSANQSPVWSSDYVAVAVYMSNSGSGATAVPNSGSTAYTIDYLKGTITFTTAQAAGITVSIDARPLAMRPELMLQHLFVDFGSFDRNFLKFDTSGIFLPVMEISRDRSIWDIAKDIAASTAPRGIRWQIFFNELGYLCFSEMAIDAPPVKTLIDERDLLTWKPEYTSRTITNVVRATATSQSSQPLVSLSYDLNSINAFGQKPTYDVPSQYTATVPGMDSGSAMALMNRLTSSVLFEAASPAIQAEAQIFPDPSLSVGDTVSIIDRRSGTADNFYIKQINEEILGQDYTQTLRLEQYRASQDFMAGLQTYAGAPNAANANAIQAQSGLLSAISIAGTAVLTNGAPVTDQRYSPIIPQWTGGNLNISITLAAVPSGASVYIWRWMYISADVYSNGALVTGLGNAANPYATLQNAFNDVAGRQYGYTSPAAADVRSGTDTAISRRYYWPLLRPSDWVSGDGITAYTSATPQTLSSSWSAGPGNGTSTSASIYGRLITGVSSNDSVSGNFVGQALFAPGTPAATAIGASSTASYGIDFGTPYTSTNPLYYQITRKVTPCYLGIMVASTQGTFQLKRIPFFLVA